MRNRLLIYLKKYFAIFQNFSFAKGSCELEKGKRSIVMATANFQYCYYSNCAHPPLETARFFFCCPVATFCTNISELWQRSLKNFDKLNVENAEEKEKTAKPHKKSTVRWRCHGEVSLLGRGTRRKETTASPWQL